MGAILNNTAAKTHGVNSSTEERALSLLGAGISTEATASACGVSISRISQLLADESFAAQVAALRYEALQKHNQQDSELDSIESLLTTKFKESIPLMMRPMEILKGLQVINAAKRRGSEKLVEIDAKAQIVNITLPAVTINNFTKASLVTNVHNQVVSIAAEGSNGESTDLTTIQSSTLLNQHKNNELKAGAEHQETIKGRVRELLSSNESTPHVNSTPKQRVDRSPENI